jgi:hypothetical protein
MEDGSRLGRKDDSMLVENIAWELDVPLLFSHLVPKHSFLFPFYILSVMINY